MIKDVKYMTASIVFGMERPSGSVKKRMGAV
ncbi:hypothetical protein FHS91_003919 [Sphingobium xanthum]